MISIMMFDLGGVLVEFDYNAFLFNSSSCYNITADKFRNHQSIALHEDFMRGRISSEQFFQSIRSDLDTAISRDLFEKLWNSIIIKERTDTSLIVDKLQNRYELVLMSNTDPWHFSFCYDHFPVVRKFDNRFLSYKTHAIKPEKDFYLHALRVLNVESQNCLFIDDLIENVDSASALGFNAIHFQNGSQLESELVKLNLI